MPLNDQALRRLLIRHEGLKLAPYLCSAGRWTIGVGRNLEDNGLDATEYAALPTLHPVLREREGRWFFFRPQACLARFCCISEPHALWLLDRDIAEVTRGLRAGWPWMARLDPVRWAAFVSLAFNMGVGNLSQFAPTLLHAQAGEWADVALHLLDSRYAEQVPARAARVAGMLQSGHWPA